MCPTVCFVVVDFKTGVIPGWYTGRVRLKVDKKRERKEKENTEEMTAVNREREETRFLSK